MTRKNTEQVGPLCLREERSKGRATGRWILDIPAGFDGNLNRKRQRFASKTSCRNAARKLIKGKQLQQHDTSNGASGYTLNDIFNDWFEAENKKIAAGIKKSDSLRTDVSSLAHVLGYFGLKDIGLIDADAVLEYQGKRRGDGYKAVTINTETRKLKALMNWCYSRRLIDRQLSFRPLPEPKVNTEVPNLDEMVKILEQLPFKVRVLMRIMIETGLRKSETHNLRWEDIDLERKQIVIGRSENFTPKTIESARTVSFGEGLKTDLLKLHCDGASKSNWLFPSKWNPDKPMDNCRKSLKSAIERSGVMRHGKPIKFTPKYARKAFSSYQWINGTPLELIKKKMGHSPSSRVTEKHYLHLSDELMSENIVEVPLK